MEDLFADCEKYVITLNPKEKEIAERYGTIWKWERRLEDADVRWKPDL